MKLLLEWFNGKSKHEQAEGAVKLIKENLEPAISNYSTFLESMHKQLICLNVGLNAI